MEDQKWCEINSRLLPIKAHYFFLFGGMAGTVTFMPVIAKGLGFHATAVGVLYTLLPFCIFLSKFAFGYITDYFRNIKVIMVILSVVTAILFMLVLLIPPLDKTTKKGVKIIADCSNNSDQLPSEIEDSITFCLNDSTAEETTCYLISDEYFNSTKVEGVHREIYIPIFDYNSTKTEYKIFDYNISESNEFSYECDCLRNKTVFIVCAFNSSCPLHKENKSSCVYRSFNFWVFLILNTLSGSGASSAFCLNDAACYEVLNENTPLYGQQRLWGTIGWGVFSLLTGYLNGIVTGNSDTVDYSPGFYLMFGLMIIDVAILLNLFLVKTKISVNICKDVGLIFASYRTVLLSITVYICGIMFGLIWNYHLWYLQDLGASQLLLGLVMAVQCLASEVPFFFFSGWVITKLGHFYSMFIVFVGFALRFGLYSALHDPWLSLPIELLHGVTFALSYATMTNYSANNAPPGTETTMMGVLQGLYEGLGVATGSLLGGVSLDLLGGRMTFFAASMISLIWAPSLLIANYIINRVSPEESSKSLLQDSNANAQYGSSNQYEMYKE